MVFIKRWKMGSFWSLFYWECIEGRRLERGKTSEEIVVKKASFLVPN